MRLKLALQPATCDYELENLTGTSTATVQAQFKNTLKRNGKSYSDKGLISLLLA